ncbi:MAG TPA: thioredoxin [Bacteroidales bacterium]|nr:thioredoxin [Bacteroidales bacterium]
MRKRIWIFVVLIIGAISISCNNNSENKKETTDTEDQNNEVVVDKKTSSFDEQINGSVPVLVDFYADWCKPCQAQSPIIDELKEELGEKIVVIKVNVDVETEITERYSIQSIPTLIIFKEGEIVWKAVGLQEKEVIAEAVNSVQ